MEISVIAAQSIDGFIAKHEVPGSAFTSEADKLHFRSILRTFDALIFGRLTYEAARATIRTRLTASLPRFVMTRSPQDWLADAVDGQLEFTNDSPITLVNRLRARGFRRCAVLGGSQIHSLYLESGLIDTLILTLEPCLFGQGVPLLHRQADARLKLESATRLPHSDSLLLTYRLIK
ncbi:MAG: dihydrofolate reductase family protein [Opitutaceae bacterium]|nr:dihydrofolate reductase family protein [Opitutaceae bacterium]